MADPKIVARELFGHVHLVSTGMWPESVALSETNKKCCVDMIYKALLDERTTAYKAGMERAAEIADEICVGYHGKEHPGLMPVSEEIAQAIRTEANKEIK